VVWFVLGGASVSVAQESSEEIKPLPLETKLRPLEPFVALPTSPSPLKSVSPLVRPDRPKRRGVWYYFSPVPKNWQEAVLYGGLTVDMISTIQFAQRPQCVGGHCDPRAFTEAGWARFVGNRNTAGVVTANIGLDVGIIALNRYLQLKTKGKRGGWRMLRFVANSFLVGKGFEHGYSARNNFRYTRGWEKYLASR